MESSFGHWESFGRRYLLTPALGLVFFFTMVVQCLAETKIYGPDFSRFSLEVPKNWVSKATKNGCILTAKDGKTSIRVQIYPNDGKTAKQIAKLIGQNLAGKGKILKVEEDAQNEVTVYVEVDKRRLVMLISAKKEKFATMTLAGVDMDNMQKVLKSIKDLKTDTSKDAKTNTTKDAKTHTTKDANTNTTEMIKP